jgi:hypothetical protein
MNAQNGPFRAAWSFQAITMTTPSQMAAAAARK